MLEINTPKTLNEESFEKFLETLHKLICLHGTLKIDLSKTEFITSYAMCSLVLLCNFLVEADKRKIHLVLSNPLRKQYLHSCLHIAARLGFFECLSEEISCYPYRPKIRSNKIGSNSSILEVTTVNNEEEMYRVIKRAKDAIKKNTQYPENHVFDICNMISEILQNTIYHSKAIKPAIIAIQKYPKLNRTELVIADCGIGIPNTIIEAKEFKNSSLKDYEAIIESLKRGVSRYGKEDGRGEGLERCYKLSEKYKAILFIRSNKGYVRYNFSDRLRRGSDKTYFQGTQIFIDFPS